MTQHWSTVGAWREILERIFEGFEYREDFSPDWMINPQTRRRLKLDRYYPELGIAFRFVGMVGLTPRRVSEEELQQEEERNRIREWLCERQGVTLVALDVNDPEPWRQLSAIHAALGRTSRLLAQSEVELEYKGCLALRLSQARRVCDMIRTRARQGEEGLKLFAELWRDRQFRQPAEISDPMLRTPRRQYRVGMPVIHQTFGRGMVMELHDTEDDSMVVVRFDDGVERKFLATLVSDKLVPQKS